MREESPVFSSRMSRFEAALALGWLPLHVFLLPLLLVRLFPQMDGVDLNFWIYAAGALVLGLCCLPFLRRDFDRLWERPLLVLAQIAIGYVLMLLGSDLVALLMRQLSGLLKPEENPNNAALEALANRDLGKMQAVAIFLSPLVEELMFRGGIYGLLRRRSRIAATLVCILLFSVYHTWQYALLDPVKWLYLLQYLPASWVLCRVYEKTETIWTPLLFHMLNNAVSLWAMNL